METYTFVIPAYIRQGDGKRFLCDVIEGMKLQDDQNWQAIIVNDNSPVDGIIELLDAQCRDDGRINYINLDERKSTGVCRNIGIEWAAKRDSPVIMFNDADDISAPGRVGTLRRIFRERGHVDVVYSDFYVIDQNKKPVQKGQLSPGITEILDALKDPPEGPDCWYSFGLEKGYTNITSATNVRTKLAMAEPFPDEFVSEDMHTWFRYAARGEFLFVEGISTAYRIPSYVKRQSSVEYVEDFARTKMRVDKDGFQAALQQALKGRQIDRKDRYLIEAKFLINLSESMGKVNRLDLVYELSLDIRKLLDLIQIDIKIK